MRITSARHLAMCAAFCMLSACQSHRSLDAVSLEGGDFLSTLAGEYRRYSESEAQQFDWRDANHFADKALTASSGAYPEPDMPSERNLPTYAKDNLLAARQTVLSLLSPDIRARFPSHAARLQLLYDCWVEQQEEQWQQGHIASCAAEFDIARMSLEQAINDRQEAFRLLQERNQYRTHTLFFAFDSAALDRTSEETITELALLLERYPQLHATITGYTDLVGDRDYNRRLALRRADAVMQSLLKQDVEQQRLSVGINATDSQQPAPQGPAKAMRRVAVELFVK